MAEQQHPGAFSTGKTIPVLLTLAIWGAALGLNYLFSKHASPVTAAVIFVFLLAVFGGTKFMIEGDKVVTKALWARHVVPISEINDLKIVDGFWFRQFGLAGVQFRRKGSNRFNTFSNAKDARGLVIAIQSNGTY